MRKILFFVFSIMVISVGLSAADWKYATLDNGLKVMILENHQVPLANISTTVKVGAKNETAYFDGATHLLEHLILFRGTEKMNGEEVGAAMKKHGAYFNGYTSQDWTDFVISLPSEFLDFALSIHSDMLFRSSFSAAAMDQERQAVMEEININEDNPGSKAYRSMVKVLFKGHPYEKNVLGTKGNIESIPRDSVYAYYKRYYAPNNMTLVIVGDVDADQALALVKKYFGDIPKGSNPVDQYSPPPAPKDVARQEIKKDIAQAYLMIGMIGPKADSPDQYACDLMSSMLGNGESSRLWKTLREQKGLVYSASFSFNTTKYEGPIYAFAVCDPDKLPEVESGIKEILNNAKTNGFTEEELRKAKNSILTSYYTSHERGLDIADNYAQYDSFISHGFIDKYPARIEQVTLAEVAAAARKYLNTDSYVLTTVVPK
ncbi:putative Mitochondrial processing peptidase [Candidatus Zixiibacteriota bacterium]|nr:putative Mitochondrial processing peptidase [candidate division Zixibacteria bacterium]